MTRRGGFSVIELLVAFVVLGIVAAIAIPGFSRWLPDYRLKSAARNLYSDMQLAKMGAIRANANWAIVFDPGVTPGRYSVCSDDGPNDSWDGPAAMGGDDVAEKTVDLAYYKSDVDYGHGNATSPVGAGWDDDITYGANVAVFNSRGTCNAGYVYLENSKNTTTYAAGTRSSGVIRLLKWNGAAWE